VTPTSGATGIRLVAKTVALEGNLDLADVAGEHGVLWERPQGLSLAGWGVATRVPVRWSGASAGEDVAAALGAIEWDGPRSPVAVGALPFLRSDQAEMVVPAVLVRRELDGSMWLTVTASDPTEALDEIHRRLLSRPARRDSDAPKEYHVRSVMERDAWCRLVVEAAATVAAGRLAKVVLAREVIVDADRALRPTDVARRLRRSHPSCTVFCVDGFVGASPELLVERIGTGVRSEPLAGTAARPGWSGGDEELGPRLLSSAKERQEHRLVVDGVAGALERYCSQLDVPETPALVPLGTLAHLGTQIVGTLAHPRSHCCRSGRRHPSQPRGGGNAHGRGTALHRPGGDVGAGSVRGTGGLGGRHR
jgi:menaquinone-specific isochorismate synthase